MFWRAHESANDQDPRNELSASHQLVGEMFQAINSLRTKFPANREFNREFRKFRASAAISVSNQRANSKACGQIPYATEQGIFAAITGNFFGITGNLIERAAKSLSCWSGRRISTALDVNSWHFCGIARSVDFSPLAEGAGAADIAGDAPELAVERRRSSYSPLLLSPAIGQRAGELCEGEIGRRGAVEQCRHDPG